jgi:hypothetical protein
MTIQSHTVAGPPLYFPFVHVDKRDSEIARTQGIPHSTTNATCAHDEDICRPTI